MSDSSIEKSMPKRENMWLNIGFNLVLPIVILRKGDDWFGSLLGKFFNSTPDSPLVGSIILLLAILFPISYGIMDLIKRGSGISFLFSVP